MPGAGQGILYYVLGNVIHGQQWRLAGAVVDVVIVIFIIDGIRAQSAQVCAAEAVPGWRAGTGRGRPPEGCALVALILDSHGSDECISISGRSFIAGG